MGKDMYRFIDGIEEESKKKGLILRPEVMEILYKICDNMDNPEELEKCYKEMDSLKKRITGK